LDQNNDVIDDVDNDGGGERDNEIAQRKAYHSAVRQFFDTYPSVNKTDLDHLLEIHNDAATAGFVDDVRTRWDFPGSFHFVTTVVSTIGMSRRFSYICDKFSGRIERAKCGLLRSIIPTSVSLSVTRHRAASLYKHGWMDRRPA